MRRQSTAETDDECQTISRDTFPGSQSVSLLSSKESLLEVRLRQEFGKHKRIFRYLNNAQVIGPSPIS